MPVLEARGINKRFGAVVALDNAGLDVEPGEVHVLIGSNGSGKSTLCKIIAGSVIPDTGELLIEGKPAIINSPKDAADSGIGVFYQELSLVPQLSIQENLFLGELPQKGPGFVDRAAMKKRAEELIARFTGVTGEGFAPDALVQDLRNDQRQIVEVLKVLALDSRIIIFDEPTSCLDKRQVTVFFDIVRDLREQGRSIIFISHRMDEIMEIGDRVTVLRDGRPAACLPVSETDRDSLVEHMVGSRIAISASEKRDIGEDAVLTVENLSGPRLDNISFSLHRGEILGFGGLHGQGQSEVLRMLFGAEHASGANVKLADSPKRPSKPSEAVRNGLAYISGDRGRDGVLLIRPILENLAAADLTRRRRFLLSPKKLTDRIAPIIDRLKMKFSGYKAPISSLSGGNQQKAVIGRWLMIKPRILLLDDPTKGIDLQAKADLYAIMRELVLEGVSIILYSSEDSELLNVADRILVFNGGRIVTTLEGDDKTAFKLYQAAYGAVS